MRARLLSSATYHIYVYMVLSSDHLTPATGKTVTVTLSKNGAAFGAASGAVTEISSGVYKLAANATDSNTLGSLLLLAAATGCDPYLAEYTIVAFDPFVATNLGLSALPTASAGASGGLPTLDTNLSVLSNVLFRGTASAGAANTITLAGAVATDNFYKYALVQITGGTGAGQTPRMIVNYVGSTKVATIAGAWTTNPDNTSVFAILPTPRGVFAHSGIAQAGAAGTITLASIASASDNVYNSALIWIDGGTGIGEQTIITAYNGTTKVATITPNWAVTPDSTSIYHVMSNGRASADNLGTNAQTQTAQAVLNAVAASYNTAGSIGAAINNAGGAADPLNNAVPGSYAAGSAGAALGLIPTIQSELTSATITIVSPVNPSSGALTLYDDSDYTAASGQTLPAWSSADWTVFDLSNAASVTAYYRTTGTGTDTAFGTIVVDSDTAIHLVLTHQQAAALPYGASAATYKIVATLDVAHGSAVEQIVNGSLNHYAYGSP